MSAKSATSVEADTTTNGTQAATPVLTIETERSNAALVAKIAAAVLEVAGGGDPQGHNKNQSYAYHTTEQVLLGTIQALARKGVICLSSVTDLDVDTVQITTAAGVARSRYDAHVKYAMLVTDGVGELFATWAGMGVSFESPDKAGYSAETSAHKYFLLKLFGIAADRDTNDSEHAAGEEGAVTGAQRAARSGASDVPMCPVCHKNMWDNRPKKASGEYSEKSPDFKCKDKTCGGVIWSALQLQPGHSMGPADDDSQVPDKANALAKVAELLKVLYGDKATHLGQEFAKWASQDRTINLAELNLGEVQMCEAELQARYAKRANANTAAAAKPA